MMKDWNEPKLEVLDVKMTFKGWNNPKPPVGGDPQDPENPEVPDLDS